MSGSCVPFIQPKKFPSEKEYERIMANTLNKMNEVWIGFYHDYAASCGANFHEFEFPKIEEIFVQFENFLKRNRQPDYPKRKRDQAHETYGDHCRRRQVNLGGSENYKRQKTDNGWGEDESQNNQQTTDNGWGDEEMQNNQNDWENKHFNSLTSTPLHQSSNDWNENDVNNGLSENRSNRFNDRRGRGGFRGNERGRGNFRGNDRGRGFYRGGRGFNRGGFNRGGFNRNDRYKNNDDDGFKSMSSGSVQASGWSDDETTEQNKSPPRKSTIQASNDDWDDDDSSSIQQSDTKKIVNENWDESIAFAGNDTNPIPPAAPAKASNDDDWD